MNARSVTNEADAALPQDATDEALVRRVQEGDGEAFETIARRYMRPVHAVVSSIVNGPDDADDTVQETFLRALERIRSYNPNRPFAPWLYQVARNVARNRRKYIRSRTHEELTDIEHGGVGGKRNQPDRQAELSELRRDLEAAVDSLPERQRAAFRLHDIEGFKANEIAEMLGVSDGTVRANVHHARRILRKRLEGHHQEPAS